MTDLPDVRRTELVTPDGRRLVVHVAGPDDAPPLLYHHGTPGVGLPAATWLAAAVERGLRWVGMSRPGYGGSDRLAGRDVAAAAADAAVVLDALGADGAYVAGWSGGGPHALATAALLPARTRAVAVVAGVGPWDAEDLDPTAGMGLANVEEFAAAAEGERVLRPHLDEQRRDLLAASEAELVAALSTLLPEADVRTLRGPAGPWLASTFHAALADGVDGWLDDDLAFVRPWGFDPASLVDVPVALWQGEEDLMVPAEHASWLADKIPHADLHLLARHGHVSLAVERAGEVVEALVAAAR